MLLLIQISEGGGYMAGLSSAQMAKIDSALKRANTRISRLEDAFGRQSSTFKNQISTFEKGPLHKYVGESASGHWKLDKGKIMKDIRSGNLNYDQANEILRNAGGVKIDHSGNVVQSRFGGFQTRKEIQKQTLETIDAGGLDLSQFYGKDGFLDLNTKTLNEITEYLNEISESFQTEYDETPLSESEQKKDPILSKLYSSENGGTRGKGKLTYGELQEISQRLKEVKNTFEKDRAIGKRNNDFLSNKE